MNEVMVRICLWEWKIDLLGNKTKVNKKVMILERIVLNGIPLYKEKEKNAKTESLLPFRPYIQIFNGSTTIIFNELAQ